MGIRRARLGRRRLGRARRPESLDPFGAVFDIPIVNDKDPVGFIVHKHHDDPGLQAREPGDDRYFTPSREPEIWLRQADAATYASPDTVPDDAFQMPGSLRFHGPPDGGDPVNRIARGVLTPVPARPRRLPRSKNAPTSRRVRR